MCIAPQEKGKVTVRQAGHCPLHHKGSLTTLRQDEKSMLVTQQSQPAAQWQPNISVALFLSPNRMIQVTAALFGIDSLREGCCRTCRCTCVLTLFSGKYSIKERKIQHVTIVIKQVYNIFLKFERPK